MSVALLLVALATAVTPAPGVIDRGGLALSVPPEWHEAAPPRTANGAVTVTLGPRMGAGFSLLLTVLPARPAGADTRAVVQAQGRKLLRTAVEATLSVEELRGDACGGHYFALTDRAAGTGEFEHILQGVVACGSRQVSFTLLMHRPGDPARAAALELLRTARPRGDTGP